ncbi:class V aminotransferase [Pontibacillus halophilus JSM 076056 = DSM 19796]|uniref:Tritium exchange subunit n=1 Tax=Pontibacillus halophilus JSM 076056 = DSM 19796 TaxID=1385510 RepID=A0A0A5I822_9BACI|nr:alanine--glyoxylate aminotransferase family protein [Pontibacillus halophilus]KGX91982.1 class V aminotransferase [Pontibacillus halophilus JSM 076056 = DSM 19796]
MLPNEHHLRTPGPTPIPETVKHAMNQPMIGHRSSHFSDLFNEVAPRLKPIFGTEQPVHVLTSSGTGALESAVTNTVSHGEKVLVVVAGAFGDRFASICERYPYDVERLEVPFGESVKEEALLQALDTHSNVAAVVFTYCETSTGVLQPVEKLTKIVKEHSNALVLVDGVSCIGGVPTQMDEWGIDVLVTGSQKAMMLPPGLSLIAFSERARSKASEIDSLTFYFDLSAYEKQYENGMTPFTPAVSLIYGLQEVCNLLDQEGLENVFKRHELMKNMTRAGIEALGLPLLTNEKDASPTVTAVLGTEQVNTDELRKHVQKKYGLSLAGGQKQLKGKILRIGHMGYCSPTDVLTTLTLLELGLYDLGYPVQFGQSVKAAQEVYVQHA